MWILDEMRKISYRDYCTGFFFGDPKDDANISLRGGYNREWDVMAVVEEWKDGVAFCTQRNRFFNGDELEVLESDKPPFTVTAVGLKNSDNEPIEAANHPMMHFSFDCTTPLENGAILRKERDEAARVIV